MTPDHPFPTPTDDCYEVLVGLLATPHKYNADPTRLVLAGDSAGGNAVAVTTQRLLKEKRQLPKVQVLIYPWTQMVNSIMPSQVRYYKTGLIGNWNVTLSKLAMWYLGVDKVSDEIERVFLENHHFGLIEDANEHARIRACLDTSKIPEKYKPDPFYYDVEENAHLTELPTKVPESSALKSDDGELAEVFRKLFDARISPLLADMSDLVGSPKTYFLILEWDPIKDEGLLYAERLKEAGVDVEIAFYEKAFHGIAAMTQGNIGYKIAREMQTDLVNYLRQNL
jgi:acetyl esterase/lipase